MPPGATKPSRRIRRRTGSGVSRRSRTTSGRSRPSWQPRSSTTSATGITSWRGSVRGYRRTRKPTGARAGHGRRRTPNAAGKPTGKPTAATVLVRGRRSVAKPDRVVETVESLGIRPYCPELDTRRPGDPGRIRDQAEYRRVCLDETCPSCRLSPLAEWSDERDANWGMDISGEDRVRLFASAWARIREWRADPAPPEGADNFVGLRGRIPVESAIVSMETLGVLARVRRVRKRRPSGRRIPGSATPQPPEPSR